MSFQSNNILENLRQAREKIEQLQNALCQALAYKEKYPKE
jgi:hypothetical protein